MSGQNRLYHMSKKGEPLSYTTFCFSNSRYSSEDEDILGNQRPGWTHDTMDRWPQAKEREEK